MTAIGEIKIVSALSTMFDGTGLGKQSWKGFAICNGANGVLDLRGRTLFGYDDRENDPRRTLCRGLGGLL